MNKKKALLVMAATGNYLFSVGNVLLGLKKYSPNMFNDILIYTDETASPQDKETIQKIFPVTFKIYDYQLPDKKERERLSYYSNMSYARFEMLTYLDKYEKVFWFDSDFLITGDISGLLEYGKTGVSMSIDLEPYPDNHGVHKFFIKNIEGYNMNALAYATGSIIFSDKLKEPLKLREYLYKQLEKYASNVTYAEQGIIHLMIEDFNLEVETFPKLVYHAFTFEDKTNAKLIHLLGDSKPWAYFTGTAYDEWYENHKKWIELGGDEAFTFKELIAEKQKYFYGTRRYQNILLIKEFDKKLNTYNAQTETPENFYNNVLQRIFSIKNLKTKTKIYKVITILGIKIKIYKSEV